MLCCIPQTDRVEVLLVSHQEVTSLLIANRESEWRGEMRELIIHSVHIGVVTDPLDESFQTHTFVGGMLIHQHQSVFSRCGTYDTHDEFIIDMSDDLR